MGQDEALALIEQAAAEGWTKLNLSSSSLFDLDILSEIPEEIGNLSALTYLNLSGNRITEIPEVIYQLQNLLELDLSKNKISSIPITIANLSNLTILKLSFNQLSSIPDAITNLSNLTKLFLSSNQISYIPESIANLSNLTKLSLSSNQISYIPESIVNLPNLKEFTVNNNPINNITLEILRSNKTKDILNYLRQIYANETRPLHEAKLLLVGQGYVGKTSLVERLLRYHFDKNQPQTDGLNVETWQVQVNSKDVRLNVWDFGGQEIYHATHQFFLTKRSLYLLVCNCRTSEEENRIEYWLKLIASFGGASPVIIVGNKKDEQPFDINRKALREKYPNIQAIIETSCQDNLGIDELRKAIYTEIADLKEVYDLLPLPWFEVKEHLEAMTQDFISYNQYLGICHTKNISEEQSQEQLIDLLHRLGLVLNFREHDFLKNTNVLKPQWVTEGIYTLLSDETLKTINKGIFAYADLSRILDPQRYPEQRHRYLIELMKEFELCFTLDCSPLRFLIPGLLPKDEPEDTELEGETLEFQYHYQVLPQSIISRFIVLTHTQIHNETYWRSGVMLEDKEGKETLNIARIKADPEDKKIFITISGREQTRRSFLKTIRDVFKKIHSSFSNPQITEWVPVPHHPDHPPLDYQELLGLEDMGESEVKIGKLKLKINLRQLLDGYEDIYSRQRSQKGDHFEPYGEYGKAYEDMREIAKLGASRKIEVKAEATAVSKESKYTNNLQGANIANLVNEANDEATITATEFTQNSTTKTTELIQIINNLRQTAAQFPPDIQEGIIIDLDDVETEIKKPESDRNFPKLKKRLLALITAASVIAAPIAGGVDFADKAVDFADKVVELSDKIGIELKLPSAP